MVEATDSLAGEQISAVTPEVTLPRTPDAAAAGSPPELAGQDDFETETANSSDAGPEPRAAPTDQPAETTAAAPADDTDTPATPPAQTGGEVTESAALAPLGDTGNGAAPIQRTEPQALGEAVAAEPETRAPDEAVAVLRQGETTSLTPVDTTPPPELSDPDAADAAAAQEETVEAQVAARTPPAEPCTVPPSLTLDARAAAITYAIIESPCHAGTVAELGYEGLRFAVSIDRAGTGTIAAPGFQQASDATIRFADDTRLDFNIAFNDTEKMDRVALATENALELQLHAFEFGAAPGSPGHVGPTNPRRHDDVRRSGGGYLLNYAPVDGIGQSIEIYTFWHRRRGGKGVVKLDIGIGRGGGPAAGCGGSGLEAAPDYVVLRSKKGRLQHPRLGLLAEIDCAALADSGGFVPDAIDDIVVRKR